MGTFQTWLADQLVRPENDPIGWLARQWKSHEGNRPKVSSPTGIGRYLEEQAGEDAQLRGYVNEAVKTATESYRAREAGPLVTRDGEPANAAAEAELNPATGKPVAVVPGSAWVKHPNAVDFGTCTVCGWPRGLAKAGTRHGEVITCAAGHIFEPEKPGSPPAATGPEGGTTASGGPTTAPEPPATTGDGATAGGTPATAETLAQPPFMPMTGPVQPPPEDECAGADEPTVQELLEQNVTLQGMIIHVLARIARHIGLPPERLDAFAEGSVDATRTAEMREAWGSAPLPASYAEWQAEGRAPADLSSQLYGLAGQPAAPQAPNEPQAYASWWATAEHGESGG